MGIFILFAKSVTLKNKPPTCKSFKSLRTRRLCQKYRLGRFVSMKPLFKIKLKENCHLLFRFSHGEEDCGQSGHNKYWKGGLSLYSNDKLCCCSFMSVAGSSACNLNLFWECFSREVTGNFYYFYDGPKCMAKGRPLTVAAPKEPENIGRAVHFRSRGETEAKLFSLRNEKK